MDPYTIEQLEGPRQEAEEIIALARINEPARAPIAVLITTGTSMRR